MLKYNKYTVYSVLSYVKIASRILYIGKEGATDSRSVLFILSSASAGQSNIVI